MGLVKEDMKSIGLFEEWFNTQRKIIKAAVEKEYKKDKNPEVYDELESWDDNEDYMSEAYQAGWAAKEDDLKQLAIDIVKEQKLLLPFLIASYGGLYLIESGTPLFWIGLFFAPYFLMWICMVLYECILIFKYSLEIYQRYFA